jgi:hypothetical protein
MQLHERPLSEDCTSTGQPREITSLFIHKMGTKHENAREEMWARRTIVLRLTNRNTQKAMHFVPMMHSLPFDAFTLSEQFNRHRLL